jgi:Cap4, dsDNA endonuclease domain
MSTVGYKRLGEIEPRERAGAQTGRRYEYQYERTAAAALTILDDATKHVCVYCDWHDDFVIERGDPPTRYAFHQVKTRKSSQGPWRFTDFFGVVKREKRPLPNKAGKIGADAIVPAMLLHHRKFLASCEGIAFVTNTGFETQLDEFLDALKSATTIADLETDDRTAFDFIALHYLASKTPLADTAQELFDRIRAIKVIPDQGKLEEGNNAALLELADMIENYSEIGLKTPQSKNIARQLIDRVRSKAHHARTVVPADDQILRHEKGIVVADLLKVLSLSVGGYEALRRGDSPETVKSLSRLQRFCRAQGKEHLVDDICKIKAEWSAWRTAARHSMDGADWIVLINRATDVVQANHLIGRMGEEAEAIAAEFVGRSVVPLTKTHVLGLMFELIAGAEPPMDAR